MSGRSGPIAGPGDGRHLLVVDDDDRIRELLKEFLTREGYRVTGAAHAAALVHDGQEGVDVFLADAIGDGDHHRAAARFDRQLRLRLGPAPQQVEEGLSLPGA